MSKARLVITAIEVEGRTPAEVVAAYGVSRSWLHELLAPYRAEGDAAFEPRSRRPHSSFRATPPDTVELVLRLRKQLSEAGLDAGADTLGWHLTHRHQTTASGEPTPEPTSCSWSRISTSASSTPHRRTAPRTRPRPHPRLPAHRPTTRPHPEKAVARTHESWVRAMPMSCDITE
ncbi:MAG: Integrase catalytic region [Frankiales bacterium]|nr:Integrase catalytic region [Frankiales bacterium]